MDDKERKKIIDKIEDLNQTRAMLHRTIESLEDKKGKISEKKYEKLKKRYAEKHDKIRSKIHELEMKLKHPT